jgi:hypothetical protein
MSRQEQAETEKQIKMVVLCIMLGLFLGLAVATVIVFQRNVWEYRGTVPPLHPREGQVSRQE